VAHADLPVADARLRVRRHLSNESAGSSRSKVGRRGGSARDYDERTKEQLLRRARQVGIKGRSKMSKRELVSALRHH
jgi:hypothetical protein